MSSSTGSSGGRYGPWVTGVPKKCWCGHNIIAKISRTEENPFRRYFRCWYAADQKLSDDQHVFKWIDEALLDEVDKAANKYVKLKAQIEQLENHIAECVAGLKNKTTGVVVRDESIRESIVDPLDLLVLDEKISNMVDAKMRCTKKWVKKTVIASFVCMAAVVVFSNNVGR